MKDGRALSDQALEMVYKNLINGMSNPEEIHAVFQTVHVQQRVLLQLFALFEPPTWGREYKASVRRSVLMHLKELVNMRTEADDQ